MLATNCNCFSGACCLLAPTGYASYAPSKWAVRGLADCLHNELQGTGVHISVAYPPDTGERGCGWASMQRAGDVALRAACLLLAEQLPLPALGWQLCRCKPVICAHSRTHLPQHSSNGAS